MMTLIMDTRFTRRAAMQAIGATASLLPLSAQSLNAPPVPPTPSGGPTTSTVEDRNRRLEWWRDARFGMFIHWGLYSVYGRHEWVMENEGIPVAEYEQTAKRFKPEPNAARAWAKLAKKAGMKYMVMTTKHHEGFCHFDSKLTNYTSPKSGPGRDLVREFVDAARAEDMRVGFYYSLMDWHHPDGALCANDEGARRRFVDYIHGQVRELCTNYGKLDVLWYDVNWPLKPDGWEAVKLNTMVRELQPDILINNRTGIPEDFTTPEQTIRAYAEPWEACMTMNDSWGYQKADDNWKTPKNIVRNLIRCTRDNGNYLLNIGPKGVQRETRPVFRFYRAGKQALHHGPVLAGQRTLDRRIVDQGNLRENLWDLDAGEIRADRFSSALHRIAGHASRSAGFSARSRIRGAADPGQPCSAPESHARHGRGIGSHFLQAR
jgi:alpha-L-fucosidase